MYEVDETVRVIAGIESGSGKLIRKEGLIVEIKRNSGFMVVAVAQGDHKHRESFWIETGVSVKGPEHGWVERPYGIRPSVLTRECIAASLREARDACRVDDKLRFEMAVYAFGAHVPRSEGTQEVEGDGVYQRMLCIRRCMIAFATEKRDSLADFVKGKEEEVPSRVIDAIIDYLTP